MIGHGAVVREALTWKGTVYQHQASLKGVATDCIGFITGVARNLGLPEAFAYDAAPNMRGYGRTPNPQLLIAAADKYLVRIPVSDAVPGDIFVLKFERDPMHFAIVTRRDPFYIVHAVEMRGCVVEHRVDETWRRRIVRAYRFRGIE